MSNYADPVFVFDVLKSINEFDATREKQVVYRPANPEYGRIQVVQTFGTQYEPALLKHLGHLSLSYQNPSVSTLLPREHLLRAIQLQLLA